MAKPITTPGRVSFPHVHVAQEQTNNGKTKKEYSIVLIFEPDDPGLLQLKKEALEAAKEKWPKLTRLEDLPKNPFRTDNRKGRPEFEGKVRVCFRSGESRKPGVVGPGMQPLNREDLYAGCYARVSYNCKAFEYQEGGKVISEGVSFYLNNVQKVRDGDRLDGASDANEDFEALEDTSTSSTAELFS